MHLTRMQVIEVFGAQAPLDLRMARQRAGSGARNVRQRAVEIALRYVGNITGSDGHVLRCYTDLQQRSALWVQFRRDDLRRRILRSQDSGLPARRGTAVE